MLRLFAKILGSKTSKASRPAQVRNGLRASIGVEELMPRVLPSASPFGLAAGHFSHHGTAAIVSASSSASSSATDSCQGGGQSATGSQGDDTCSHGATLFANLTDSNGATGQAQFNATTGALTVKVSGAATSVSLAVVVNGTTLGSLSTDANGTGSLTLSNVTVQSGQTITVGDLTGTFGQVHFTSALTGTTGTTGTADFNALKSRLSVTVTGAAANTTYNFTVDSVVVGQVTTNNAGAGKLHLSLTNSTIQAGSTISIADTAGDPAILQGTFG